MTDTEITQTLRKAMKLCKRDKMKGLHTHINGYYVSFEFRKLKEKCTKCGQDLE